jgi:hypothetical protein
MKNGQILVAKIMRALLKNEEQWKKTLFMITYDEHGGFYDHVQLIDSAPNDDGVLVRIPPLSGGEPRLGVRVPAFVISPYIPSMPKGLVNTSHKVFDHTSIPATIFHTFCSDHVPYLSDRTSAANDVGHLLTLENPRPMSDFENLGAEMDQIARQATVPPLGRGKPGLLRRPLQDRLEDDFQGLVSYASAITGAGRGQ